MVELNAHAVADLMHKHRRELLQFLSHRVQCTEAASDIYQETFIRFLNYSSKEKVTNPYAFICRIAANLATDYLRRQARQIKREINSDSVNQELQDLSPSLERTVISQQQCQRLSEALELLPPKCRAVFILLKLKHKSYAQVERELGISQTMIFKYLTRALTHCREYLQDDV